MIHLSGHKRTAKNSGGQSLWWYLNSTAYRLRYNAAGMMLHHRRHVLEIGGFVTPIDQFIHPNSPVQTVTNIDPIIEPYAGHDAQGRQVLRLPTSLDEYRMRGDEDAILYLGICPQFDADTLPLTPSVKTVVVGGAKYAPIMRIVDKIVARAKSQGFKKAIDLQFDFSDMVGPEHPEISPDSDNHHRRFVVMERP